MDEFLHVDGMVLIAFGIQVLMEVDPCHCLGTMKRSPTVEGIAYDILKVRKMILEPLEHLASLLCIQASREYHVTSDQEDHFGLSSLGESCSKDELVVRVPS